MSAIAFGHRSEVAGLKAGVSALVGIRWFQIASGMSPKHFAPSTRLATGHFLSFIECEDIAIALAKRYRLHAV